MSRRSDLISTTLMITGIAMLASFARMQVAEAAKWDGYEETGYETEYNEYDDDFAESDEGWNSWDDDSWSSDDDDSDPSTPQISGADDGQYYNHDLDITIEDDIQLESISLNGEAVDFPQGKIANVHVSEEGKYTLYVTDSSGNDSSISFVVDKTAPKITGVKDGKKYHKERTISYEDELSGIEEASYSIKNAPTSDYITADDHSQWGYEGTRTVHKRSQDVLNESFDSGREFDLMNGNYTITVTDKAGNEASVEFSMKEKGKPSFRFVGYNTGKKYSKDFNKKSKQVFTRPNDDEAIIRKVNLDEIMWIQQSYSEKSYPSVNANNYSYVYAYTEGYFANVTTNKSGKKFISDPGWHGNSGVVAAREGYYTIKIKTMAGTEAVYKYRVKFGKKFRKYVNNSPDSSEIKAVAAKHKKDYKKTYKNMYRVVYED